MEEISIVFLIGLLLLSPLVLLIVLIVKMSQFSDRVKRAEKRIGEMQESIDALRGGAVAHADVQLSMKTATPVPESPEIEEIKIPVSDIIPAGTVIPAAVASQAAGVEIAAEAAKPAAVPDREAPKDQGRGDRPPVPPERAASEPVPVSKPSTSQTSPAKSKAEWESIIGGRWLNRIGALALIIAVGFFLNYAFDKNWIPETVRVLLGGAAGLGLVALGWRFEKRDYQVFAQGLLGAGIAILYLSVYASFNFYHLVPQIAAFVLMSAVTALTFILAAKYDSIAVSLLGWAGGFLTPVMLNTGTANEVGLFTYIVLLDAGVIAVVLRKDSWIVLEPLSILATYLTYILWYDAYFIAPAFGVTLLFLILFWGLFSVVETVRAARPLTKDAQLRHFIAGANAAFFASLLVDLFDSAFPDWEGFALLIAGAAYLAAFVAVRDRETEQHGAHARMIVTAVILLAWATLAQFDGLRLAAVWALEGAALSTIGLRLGRRHLWTAGLAMLGLAFFALLGAEGSMAWTSIKTFKLLINERVLAYLALTASCAFVYSRWPKETSSQLRIVRPLLLYACAVLLFLLPTVETSDLFRTWMPVNDWHLMRGIVFQMTMSTAALWAGIAVIFAAAARFGRIPEFLYAGVVVLFLSVAMGTIRGLAFDPVSWHVPLLNVRLGALASILVAIIVFLRLTDEGIAPRWTGSLSTVLRVTFVVVLLALVTAEVRDFFELQLHGMTVLLQTPDNARAMEQVGNMQQLSLSGVWLIYSIALMTYGLLRSNRVMRVVAFVLFGFSILKIFIYDLSYLETLYRIISFAALGVILLAVSFLFQRYKDVIFGEEMAQ